MGEFERSTGEAAYEWSIPTAADQGRSYRLFVSIEADISRLVCIEECPVTSAKPGARRMEVEGDPRRSVTVTLDEARWLLATLPKAIAKVERIWAEGAEHPADPAVHVCLWSSQPDILIACDHSWTTPKWDDAGTAEPDVFLTDDGRRCTFDESLTTCVACLATLSDPEKREKAGTP
jgi:hypothetical protein